MITTSFTKRFNAKAFAYALAAVLTMSSTGIPAEASSQYPDRPVHVIVPYGAGGLADLVPRVLTNAIGKQFPQPFIIETKPGAGGTIGSEYVLRQPADGHTILSAATNNLVMNQFLFKHQKQDPLESFVPVSKLATVPLVLAVNANLPVENLGEFVQYLRDHADKTHFGSPSAGTVPHVSTEIFLEEVGARSTHVAYRGGGAMAIALAAGDIQFAFIGYSTIQGVLAAGKVKALAVVAPERLAVMADVPTVAEAGYAQLNNRIPPNWWAFVVKSETPRDVIVSLSNLIEKELKNPEVIASYESMGMVASHQGSAEMKAALPAEAALWKHKIEQLGIVLN